MTPHDVKIVLTERFVCHMKLSKGGAVYLYHILDGDEIVGVKTVQRETRSSPWERATRGARTST